MIVKCPQCSTEIFVSTANGFCVKCNGPVYIVFANGIPIAKVLQPYYPLVTANAKCVSMPLDTSERRELEGK